MHDQKTYSIKAKDFAILVKIYYHMVCTQSLLVALILLAASDLAAQGNIGIGADEPTEKLEVTGIIYTTEGGIRFPDFTLQETAAFMSGGPGDAGMPYDPVYMTIKTSNPAITDTIRVLDISAGGVKNPGTGNTQLLTYQFIKEMDATTHALFQKCVTVSTLTEARFHFLTTTGQLHKTIELRDALVSEINHLNIHRKNDEFAHLEQVSLIATMLEIRHVFPDGSTACYCWNFISQAA